MSIILDCVDQIRYISGTLCIMFLLCHGILPERGGYLRRVAGSVFVSAMLALCFVPLKHILAEQIVRFPLRTGPYWLLMSILPTAVILFCYKTTLAGALFRTILGTVTENFVTALSRYLFVLILFPEFPEAHPVWFVILMITVYAVLYGLSFLLLRPRVLQDESGFYPQPKTAALTFLFIYLFYTIIFHAIKSVFEYVIPPLETDYRTIFRYLQFFLIAVMLLLSITMAVVMIYIYRSVLYRNEKQIILQLMKERQAQYEFSRENIEMINRKAHDLKHQLKALEMISDDERRAQIRETRKTIDFYDAVVKTGNEALDTLLTEKNVYCANRNIRLSCTVSSSHLDRLDLVDLYTLLGNALDNAIESVEKLKDDDKKTISVTIRGQGKMLFIQIENYYEGEIRMENGIPVTSKPDQYDHGFGVKSIRSTAERYGGSVFVQAQHNVFTLEVLIPEQ